MSEIALRLLQVANILIVILPLFLIIFVSAILQRFMKIEENWTTILNAYALKIGFPVLIFSALSKTGFSFSEHAPLILVNSMFLVLNFMLALGFGKLLHFDKQLLQTIFMCLAFGNVAYLGIPALMQVFGEAILPTASLIVAVYLFWKFTIGIGYLDFTQLTRKKEVFKDVILNLVKNPILLAVILGIVVSVLKIQVPSVLIRSIDMVAASVTPTVLVVIGLFIGKSRIGKLSEWRGIIVFSLVILFALPGIFYAGVLLLGFTPVQFSASILEAAMPLAITPFALADKYHLDKIFIARSIVLSTILSVFTIPLWILILQG